MARTAQKLANNGGQVLLAEVNNLVARTFLVRHCTKGVP
jgi:hypothetical protein